MARLFYASVIAGIVLTIVAAAIFPLPRHHRYPSSISVIPDGGRQESFTIQWPQDRIRAFQPVASPALMNAGGAAILSINGVIAASAEVFRLRDIAGNIIGLASRSTSVRLPGGQGTDWILLAPSRGALFLTQSNSRDVAPPTGSRGGSAVAAQDGPGFWSGAISYRITAGPAPANSGQVLGGTGEFADLAGSYDEVWELEQVAGDGSTSGRITLSTRVEARR